MSLQNIKPPIKRTLVPKKKKNQIMLSLRMHKPIHILLRKHVLMLICKVALSEWFIDSLSFPQMMQKCEISAEERSCIFIFSTVDTFRTNASQQNASTLEGAIPNQCTHEGWSPEEASKDMQKDFTENFLEGFGFQSESSLTCIKNKVGRNTDQGTFSRTSNLMQNSTNWHLLRNNITWVLLCRLFVWNDPKNLT